MHIITKGQIFFLILTSLYSNAALADLQVFPMRLVFEGTQRSAQLHLRHVGSKPTRYRISLAFFEMGPNGQLKERESASLANQFAGEIVRYSPRMVALKPQEEQIVRLQLRKPGDLKDGEYRAHIKFETFDDEDAQDAGEVSKGGVTLALKAQRALAIPIVVRNGNTSATLSFKSAKMKKTPEGMSVVVQMEKVGNRSVYGSVSLGVPGKDGAFEAIEEVKGVSLYNEARELQILIKDATKIESHAPKLAVRFVDTDTNVQSQDLTVEK